MEKLNHSTEKTFKSYRTLNSSPIQYRFYHDLIPDLSTMPFTHKPGIYKIKNHAEETEINDQLPVDEEKVLKLSI